jgi:uroporphyrinogen-III synthase
MSLTDKRVVNTRAVHQAAELDALLRARGAEPVSYPCIDIAPPADPAPLDAAIGDAAAGRFDWLALTSANTALALARRLETLGYPPGALAGLRVAAVGPATASAARDLLGIEVDAIPDDYQAEALADALQTPTGTRVFLPQSGIARPTLAEKLVAAGMVVSVVPAYQTVIGAGGASVPAMLEAGQIDGVTFTSPSTVTNFIRRLASQGGDTAHLENVCIACIGPSTAEAARASGLRVSVIPAEHTLDGLVAGLETFYQSKTPLRIRPDG